jgi:hypothetical protein
MGGYKMRLINRTIRKRRGIALIVTMMFMAVFFVMSAAMFTQSAHSVQASGNHHTSNAALNAALSGLECAQYAIARVGSIDAVFSYQQYKEGDFSTQAETIWQNFQADLQSRFTIASSGTNRIETAPIAYDGNGSTFTLRFERSDPYNIQAICTGTSGGITRTVSTAMVIEKEEEEILSYGLVGRGRMWITGDTTIYGDIFSSWSNANISPFNMTDDSTVLGTINTAITKDVIDTKSYDLETLTGDDKPMFEYSVPVYDSAGNAVSGTWGLAGQDGYMTDSSGNPVYDADGQRIPVDYATRVTSSGDEIQGYHRGINYGVQKNDMESYLDINSYDTDCYLDRVLNNGNGDIPSSSTTVTEYFPHGPNGYTHYKSGSLTVKRHVYENMTFRDVRLPNNRNALFRNCTFENVLYIDCNKNTSSNYNNVRFEDCNFNGVIVTDTPSALSWQRNALYFTGSANFNNTSDIQEATILAPHFNVNLGDANNGEVESDENVITGAVVGGIVDIRGNASIYGTVISMCDTSKWTKGYVTNIGATLDDGGSETTSIEDIGRIEITPDKNQMLFPGLKEYPCTISLKINNSSYTEIPCGN